MWQTGTTWRNTDHALETEIIKYQDILGIIWDKCLVSQYDFLYKFFMTSSTWQCWVCRALLARLNYSIGWVRQISRDSKRLLKSNLFWEYRISIFYFQADHHFVDCECSRSNSVCLLHKSQLLHVRTQFQSFIMSSCFFFFLAFCFSTKCQNLLCINFTFISSQINMLPWFLAAKKQLYKS